MHALIYHGPHSMTMAEVEHPAPGPGEVLIAVRAVGICGSDIHGFDGSTGRRIPPLVMGHEAAGEVQQVGSSVKDFRPGDRVTFDSTVSCGKCAYCQSGRINLCDNRMVLGVSCGEYRRHGAFAEYVAVPARILYALPPSLPFEHAALIEAVSVAVHAVERKVPSPTDAVLVVGCGMIGLLVIQALRAKGCRRIVAIDVDPRRRRLAEQLGVEHTLDAGDGDMPARIRSVTGDRGADVAFEVVGRPDTLLTATRGVRKGGTVVLIGNLAPKVELPLQEVVSRELSLLGSCASSGEYPRCIELMASGAIDVAPLISATASLDEGPAWFERLHRGEPGVMKVILKP